MRLVYRELKATERAESRNGEKADSLEAQQKRVYELYLRYRKAEPLGAEGDQVTPRVCQALTTLSSHGIPTLTTLDRFLLGRAAARRSSDTERFFDQLAQRDFGLHGLSFSQPVEGTSETLDGDSLLGLFLSPLTERHRLTVHSANARLKGRIVGAPQISPGARGFRPALQSAWGPKLALANCIDGILDRQNARNLLRAEYLSLPEPNPMDWRWFCPLYGEVSKLFPGFLDSVQATESFAEALQGRGPRELPLELQLESQWRDGSRGASLRFKLHRCDGCGYPQGASSFVHKEAQWSPYEPPKTRQISGRTAAQDLLEAAHRDSGCARALA